MVLNGLVNRPAPHIVIIGGGTGNFTLLQELKLLTPNISVIVNMCDDGGSTGLLRDELGVLPPGDIRQCLAALSDTPEVRDLFSYRFNKGSLKNQSIGNMILSGLELQYGSFEQAVQVASRILHITGQVLPVSLQEHTLVLQDGVDTIRGQFVIINHAIKNADARVRLNPTVTLNPIAIAAIARADLIVISPGNLYGSLLPVLSVGGMGQALRAAAAPKIVVANLVNKPGQTDDWHVVDYVKALESYIGANQIDYVLYNDKPPSAELLRRYAAKGEFPVGTEPSRFREITASATGAHFVARAMIVHDPNDTIIKRTLIRHDANQVGRQLLRILAEQAVTDIKA